MESEPIEKAKESGAKQTITTIAIVLILVLAGLCWLFIRLDPATADLIKNIAVVFYVFEGIIVIGCLIALITQLIRLMKTLQRDILPILRTTNETANHIRGTVTFLSNNLVEPTIKASSTAAGIHSALGTASSVIKTIFK